MRRGAGLGWTGHHSRWAGCCASTRSRVTDAGSSSASSPRLATWASIGYVDTELAHGHTDAAAPVYGALTPAFLAAMVVAVCANNIGVIWVAIEATTVITAFLVGHRRTRGALEATWKYVVICSVGIAIAFLGTVLLYFAAGTPARQPAPR